LCAWLLLLLVLFNGLACSIGHGQMLRPLFSFSAADSVEHQHCHDEGGMSSMSGMESMHAMPTEAGGHDMPMQGMHSPFSDCFFAGSLLSSILVFVLISWLLRHREARPKTPSALFTASHRELLPKLNPRAP
jgi:hypothetical protein